MQFVAVKPVKLYKTAEQQLQKTEEVKITKEVKKEDAEEWQSVSQVITFVKHLYSDT